MNAPLILSLPPSSSSASSSHDSSIAPFLSHSMTLLSLLSSSSSASAPSQSISSSSGSISHPGLIRSSAAEFLHDSTKASYSFQLILQSDFFHFSHECYRCFFQRNWKSEWQFLWVIYYVFVEPSISFSVDDLLSMEFFLCDCLHINPRFHGSSWLHFLHIELWVLWLISLHVSWIEHRFLL